MTAAEREGGLWRPANGTEGRAFEAKWCQHCLNRDGDGDWEDEFGNEMGDCCSILNDAYWNGEPPEWIVRHGMPWCKAFRQDPARPSRCLFTEEMDV